MNKMIRIGVVDDHHLFRISLEELINHFSGMKVVMTASDGTEAIEKLKTEGVDVLLLDVQMPKKGGIETAKVVSKKHPGIKIIALSAIENRGIISNMLKAGISGYLTKNTAPEVLERAINNVWDGGMFFDKSIKHVIESILTMTPTEMLSSSLIYDDNLKVDFSDKELAIIKLVAEQKSNEEIALLLEKSNRTIENYKREMMSKTGSKNFIGVIVYAIKNGCLLISDIETQVYI